MNIFLRTFNPDINSKTGISLPPNAPRRGTSEWLEFEKLLIECLESLGHSGFLQLENPKYPDIDYADQFNGEEFHKRGYVHKTKRDCPHGDFYWMQMHLLNLFTFDTKGWGVEHSEYPEYPGFPDLVPEDAIEEIQGLSEQLQVSGISKCPQDEKLSETPSRFILVPIQTPRDYTIKYHSPITVKYFIDSISLWAEETQNNVAFKLHPFNKHDGDLIESVQTGSQRSRYVHKVEGNIHELIKRSSGLFLINSGTGFEALIHGKPVCTFGACDYNKVTFNADIRRIDEARNFIYSYSPSFRETAYKFIWYYMNLHAYDLTKPNTKDRLTNYLKGIL